MARFDRIVSISVKLREYRKYLYITMSRKKIRKMAKNSPKRGHSVRNGNTPSCYTKFGKRPYKYTFQGAYTKVSNANSTNKYAEQAKQR